jgi:hypothetical protein
MLIPAMLIVYLTTAGEDKIEIAIDIDTRYIVP